MRTAKPEDLHIARDILTVVGANGDLKRLDDALESLAVKLR